MEDSIAELVPVADATILVVEDKADVRQIVVRQLVDLGYRVVEAENPAEALRVLNGDGRIDVLFTDIVMPGGKTGVHLAREARQRRPALKVLFTSGFADILDVDDVEARALGPVLSKPYRKQDLARRIRDASQTPAQDKCYLLSRQADSIRTVARWNPRLVRLLAPLWTESPTTLLRA